MRIKILVVLLLLMLMVSSVNLAETIAAAGVKDAAAEEEEEIFALDFAVKVRPVVVRVKERNTDIASDQTFTITVAVKNVSSQLQEIIYYFDSPLPLSGAVVITSDAPAKPREALYYQWGTKVPIYGGEEQLLHISLSPGPNYPGPTEVGEFLTWLRIIRWLGARG